MAEKLKCIEIGIIGHSKVVRSAPMSEKDAKPPQNSYAKPSRKADS